MIKFDLTTNNIATTVGISDEREVELDQLTREAWEKLPKEELNSGQIYEAYAQVAETPEELFYVTVQASARVRHIKSILDNPLAAFLQAFKS